MVSIIDWSTLDRDMGLGTVSLRDRPSMLIQIVEHFRYLTKITNYK